MAGNDYRVDKRQVSFVVDSSLWAAVKGSAAARGWSVTRLVTELLEKEVGYGDVGIGSGDRVGASSQGGASGAYGGGSGAGHSFSGAAGRGVDWDSLLEAGKEKKFTSIFTGETVTIDPIEEIA